MSATTNPLLCVHLEQLETLRHKIGRFDLAILVGQLKFQINNSKLTDDGTKNGKKEIARSREQVADLWWKKITVTMEALAELVEMKIINKRIGLWKGKKRMFISCNNEDYNLGLDARKLEMLIRYTGSLEKSLVLSWIAYWIDKRPYHGKHHTYAMVSRKRLASFLGVHEKTVDGYMKELVDVGFINYDGTKRKRWNEWQYKVSLNLDFMDKINADWKEYKAKKAEELEKEKILFNRKNADASIKAKENSKIDIINNNTKDYEINASALVDENGVVILSKRQENYLASAIKRTLAHCDVLTWSYDTLMGHMRYVLGTPKKRNSATNFVHCINRAMLLVRSGGWKMPFGYEKYSTQGKAEHDALREREKAHYETKIVSKTESSEALQRLREAGQLPIAERGREEEVAAVEMVGDIEYFKPVEQKVDDEERQRKLADLERRWAEWKYGAA